MIGRMLLVGLVCVGSAYGQGQSVPKAAVQRPQGEKAAQILHGGPVKIVLVGDSTVATGGGWGPGFCAVMTKNVACIDDALNGRSTKSFVNEGAWQKALDRHGDYYLIQFGHNDQKPNEKLHTDAETSFQEYLHRYIADVRAIGGVPVLVTSLSRRTFKNGKVIEDLNAYAQATREVGAKDGVTVIDLNAISTALLDKMTQEEADQFDAKAHPDAKAENPAAVTASTGSPVAQPALDRTHLNAYGQRFFGRIVANELIRTQVELGPDVVGDHIERSLAN
jgi:lysophospholipase L1-like esterase